MGGWLAAVIVGHHAMGICPRTDENPALELLLMTRRTRDQRRNRQSWTQPSRRREHPSATEPSRAQGIPYFVGGRDARARGCRVNGDPLYRRSAETESGE